MKWIPAWVRPRRDCGYVLVLSIGRSGSTLLQGILNSIDGYLIRGENDNACHRLFQLTAGLERRWGQFQKTKPDRPVTRPEHPWYGIGEFDSEVFVAGTRRLVVESLLRPATSTRVTGFKEVRYALDHVPDLDGYLAYLTRLLPGVRFVVNRREPSDMAASGWWRQFKGDAVDFITRSQERLTASALASSAPVYVVSYESYVDDPATLRPLFEFLDERFDEPGVRAVLARRHSY